MSTPNSPNATGDAVALHVLTPHQEPSSDNNSGGHGEFSEPSVALPEHQPLPRPSNKSIPTNLFKIDDGQNSRIVNPFYNWSLSQVDQVAKALAFEYGLASRESLFIKAARVLHDPAKFRVYEELPAGRRLTKAEWEMRLTKGEFEALTLEHEKTTFWDLTRSLKSIYLVLFIAAIVQGWNQTATNGANLSWPQDLGLVDNSTTTNNIFANPKSVRGGTVGTASCSPAGEDLWRFAAVNAAPYLAASVGCFFSDTLINDLLFGRRGAIFASATLILSFAVGGAFVQNWKQFLACRFLLGIGMGCKAAVVPVFAAEIAPPHLRGSLVMNWQVFDTLGIVLGFSANIVASGAGKSAWRWQVVSSALPAFALLCGVAYVPWESPRFLMKHEKKFRERYERRQAIWKAKQQPPTSIRQRSLSDARDGWQRVNSEHAQSSHQDVGATARTGRWHQLARNIQLLPELVRSKPVLPYRSQAFETLCILRGSDILAAKETILTHCQLLVEMHSSEHPPKTKGPYADLSLESMSGWKHPWRLFTKHHVRREMYAAAVVMISQQLCGINVLIFYSSTIFCTAGNGQASSQSLPPLIMSWGIGLTNFLFAFPAYWTIDRLGRRWLLLTTLPCLAITMAVAAGSFAISDTIEMKALVALFTYLFTIFYSPGLGPVPFTLSAEMFPLDQRMFAMSFAVFLNFLGAGLLALLVPRTRDPKSLLGTFAGLNLVAYVLVWIYVREVAPFTTTPRAVWQQSTNGANVHEQPTYGHDNLTVNPPDKPQIAQPLGMDQMFVLFSPATKYHLRYQWKNIPAHLKLQLQRIRAVLSRPTRPQPIGPTSFYEEITNETWVKERKAEEEQRNAKRRKRQGY